MKLLLAEDEQELSRALSVILEHEGYKVVTCHDGRSALEICKNDIFDCYIFDIMMPVMDGLTLLENLRSSGDDTPALFLTAKSTTEDVINGLNAGGDDYLTKPFAMAEFLARVRVLLRRSDSKRKHQRNLTWSNITLNRRQQMLESPTMTLALAPDEAKLLSFLIEYYGQPLTRATLMDRLFAAEDSNALNLYLDYLEQKLAFVGANGRLCQENGEIWLEEITHD